MTITPTMARMITMRGRLLLDQPFWGVLALRLRLLEDPTCNTAWTDGRTLGFSPAYIATLTDDEVIFVIAHEVMHCACGHPWRRDGREPQQWNVAADHAINSILKDAGFTLSNGVLCDPQYAGQNAEYIFNRMGQKPQQDDQQDDPQDNQPQDDQQDDQQDGDGDGDQDGDDQQDGDSGGDQDGDQDGDGDGDGPGGPGDVRDAPADCADDSNTEGDWEQATVQAAQMARGTLSGGQKAAIAAAAHVAVDWRSLLSRFLTETVAADYSWARPNSRYMAAGLYLPALQSKDCGPVVVAVDTSGSIDEVLLAQFIAELSGITTDLQPRAVHVVQCDTAVNHVQTFERGEQIEVSEIYGRGGTDFRPVFDYVEREAIAPAALVYFTDLDGTFPDVEPDYPVLWAAYGSGRHQAAPWGETVPTE